ncbi:unnamed protein product [Callosobruchus maculatus]|uniref:FAM69 protein-kinase domain-containing protein n=1 Tax=Callosobruchus maculatus TaxID=64391 RepID=A0A653DUK0_CALMS|nr:unnamed protein product [Callosobruchus maculatus]
MISNMVSVKWTVILMLPIILSVCIYKQKTLVDQCEVNYCPLCYGTDMCDEIYAGKVVLQYKTLSSAFNNIFSVKNVYFAECGGEDCVLKKLVHQHEFLRIRSNGETVDKLVSYLMGDTLEVKKFKTCNRHTAETFLAQLNYSDIRHIDTLLQLNVEPLLLQLFNRSNGWPVPTFYGSCGRLAIMQYAGSDLNSIEHIPWLSRAYVAHQILQAAVNFTWNHPLFRLYLTDISPDNIVVDQNLKISFVDLEHSILSPKSEGNNLHISEHHIDEDYVFSETKICHSDISDHNIYSVCKLLLSQSAPWPMMDNGLLHHPPEQVKQKYNTMFVNIEDCVYSNELKDRFLIANYILGNLSSLLKNVIL